MGQLNVPCDEKKVGVCELLEAQPRFLLTFITGGDAKRLRLPQFFFESDVQNDESDSTTLTAPFPYGRHCWCFFMLDCSLHGCSFSTYSLWLKETMRGRLRWSGHLEDVWISSGKGCNGWTRPLLQ